MTQDLQDHWGLVDQGDQTEAPPAPRTGQDVEAEGPAHEVRPESSACAPQIRIRRVPVRRP